MQTLEVGASAPDFSLPGARGETYSLDAALRHGPVVLVFWKTSCGTSKLIFPYLERLRTAYPHESWQLWAIAQDAPEEALEFAKNNGNPTFPILIDWSEHADRRYHVSRLYHPLATPTTFLIDSHDTIAQVFLGFNKKELNDLGGRIAAFVDQPSVTIAPADDGNPPFKPG